MATVDFFISNPGHHLQMMLPAARRLGRRGDLAVRIVSLCELRGFESPSGDDLPESVRLRALLPFKPRRSPASGASAAPGGHSLLRHMARLLVWRTILLPRLNAGAPDSIALTVLPNDAAYPFDRIARHLRKRGAPFVLMQEGIRFALPQRGEAVYGAGGATAVAAWGETSAAYFKSVGVSPQRIHATGSPRFDAIQEIDWPSRREQLQRRLGLDSPRLLLITNPIDDQGFCTTAEKLNLTERFVGRLEPELRSGNLSLVLKPHGRESAAGYEKILARAAPGGRARVVTDEGLWPLLSASDAAVVMASTAGLEALLFNRPLAVLQLPNGDYAFDYVSSGAALPISMDSSDPLRLRQLFEPSEEREARAQAFVGANLTALGRSAPLVESLILSLIEGHGHR